MNDAAQSETAQEGEVILFDANNITEFNEFDSQLAKLKDDNSKVVFDFSDRKQNKAGRSHIAKLRKSKTAVGDIHKKTKAKALEFGKAVDTKKNELIEQIEVMIDVHAKPLKEFEEKEAERVAEYERKMLVFPAYKLLFETGAEVTAEDIEGMIKHLNGVEIDDTWGGYQEPARMAREEALGDLNLRLKQQQEIESNRAELDRLKQENEQREEDQRKERDNRERQEREEREEREAQEQKERDENAQKDLEQKERVDRHEYNLSNFTVYKTYGVDVYDLKFFETGLQAHLQNEIIEDYWEEFADKAKLARLDSIEGWKNLVQLKKERITEQEDLQRLQDEEEQRNLDEQKSADEKEEKERLAQDEAHRKEVNESIKEALLIVPDVNGDIADDLIDLLASGNVPNVTLNY